MILILGAALGWIGDQLDPRGFAAMAIPRTRSASSSKSRKGAAPDPDADP
ncbi:hypothetical protein [Paracoccus fontiphilus]|uniref:Uncharacterized protein n=1 Tax=Paracoccus fontiphilus TaxID=1815556 RepID=A0ABV7IFS7_9RHOB|nr:hypothetical protein [Paracoccus fontiphilus]